MALESIQPLTEMSTRNLSGDKGRPARKADNPTAICEQIVSEMWGPRRLSTLWATTACYRDIFNFLPIWCGICNYQLHTVEFRTIWSIQLRWKHVLLLCDLLQIFSGRTEDLIWLITFDHFSNPREQHLQQSIHLHRLFLLWTPRYFVSRTLLDFCS
jgi:hypothetical protein